MKAHRIITMATAGTAAVAMSFFGATAAQAAEGVQPIEYSVAVTGSIALAQTPIAAISLTAGSAASMPATVVTDTRNELVRSWNSVATASNLISTNQTIDADQITLSAAAGSFTAGSGTPTGTASVAMTADSIGSVYTYTVTATLAPQANLHAGTYAGTVTQTVS